MMTIDTLKSAMPDYAKDVKLNLSNVLQSQTLTAQQLWGSALASALATRHPVVIREVLEAAKDELSAEALQAAKAAASVMAMNNVYYRFIHLASRKDYATMPARLRMNVIGKPGIEHVDFELYSLAVSAINGCGMCVDSHEQTVVSKGVSKEAVQDVVRLASVIHAVAATLDGEAAMSGQSVEAVAA
jgi:alkyl hydroperoxide reductase subunit D